MSRGARWIGLDMGSGEDSSALVVTRRWTDGTYTVDSAILTADERLGITMYLGQSGALSYNDALRGTEAFDALLSRMGLDVREFGRAFMDWQANR